MTFNFVYSSFSRTVLLPSTHGSKTCCRQASRQFEMRALLRARNSRCVQQRRQGRRRCNGGMERCWRLSLSPNSFKSSQNEDKVLGGPYAGAFGEWFLTEADVREVRAYRAGMALVTLAAVTAVGAAWLTSGNGELPLDLAQLRSTAFVEALYWSGVAGLGIALHYIHIYLKPLHRALQYLLGFGILTSALSEWMVWTNTHDLYVHWLIQHPVGVLTGAGWVAAALTGVFFKEAFCFRRAEASVLAMLVPVLVGGHFLGWWSTASGNSGLALSTVVAIFMTVFSLRKFVQNIRDDLGDKSVFIFQRHRRL